MKIVQGDTLERERGLEHRGGMFHFRRLMEGEPGRLDNFQLTLGEQSGDFFSPRHRHNFEQIRFQFEGTLDFDRDGKMTPGMVGYFPEGAAYGPQNPVPGESPLTVVLQCGGASRSGYLSRNEAKACIDELGAVGEFDGGVFRRRADVEGKRNMDGFQAIWEHANKRPMVYPKPRYSRPVFMDPENYQWLPREGADGVMEKILGVFTECRTETGFLKLDSGAALEARGRGLFFVVSGAGKVAGEPFRRYTTLFLERGETAKFKADDRTEMLHIGLPVLADVAAVATATAAE